MNTFSSTTITVEMSMRLQVERNYIEVPNGYTYIYEDDRMFAGMLLGCVMCSEILSITAMDPYSVTDMSRFPYSKDSLFAPVYCMPCINSNPDNCCDMVVSESMISSTEAYARACEHTGMGIGLKIYSAGSIYVITSASRYGKLIEERDFLSLVDPTACMELRACENTSFFENEPFRLIDYESTDTSDDE